MSVQHTCHHVHLSMCDTCHNHHGFQSGSMEVIAVLSGFPRHSSDTLALAWLVVCFILENSHPQMRMLPLSGNTHSDCEVKVIVPGKTGPVKT